MGGDALPLRYETVAATFGTDLDGRYYMRTEYDLELPKGVCICKKASGQEDLIKQIDELWIYQSGEIGQTRSGSCSPFGLMSFGQRQDLGFVNKRSDLLFTPEEILSQIYYLVRSLPRGERAGKVYVEWATL